MRKYTEQYATNLIQSLVVEEGVSPDDILFWMDLDLGYVVSGDHNSDDVADEKWLSSLFQTLSDDELDEFINYYANSYQMA